MAYAWDGTTAAPLLTLPFNAPEATFDKVNPNLVYGIGFRAGDEAVVRSYDFSTGKVTDLFGVRDLVPDVNAAGRTYARGLATSADRITLLFGGGSQDQDRYVYVAPLSSPKSGKILDSVSKFNAHLHAISLDLSGRYMFIGPRASDIPVVGSQNILWDIDADTFTPIHEHFGGHGAFGFGEYVNNPDDDDSMDYRWRSLSAVDVLRKLVQPYPTPSEFYTDSHLSWVIPRRAVLVARYRYSPGVDAPWRAFEQELDEIDVATGAVTRIAHHQSIVSSGTDYEYWSSPKPAVSPDGRFVLFTSNWRRTLGSNSEGSRQDVFVAVLR
jgi:hypothetical protein